MADLTRTEIIKLIATATKPLNLCGVNFTNFIFNGINLSQLDLTGANLTGANLSEANLTGAFLSEAILIRVKK